MAEVRPLYIDEDRDGIVEPLDKDGNPAPVDLTKPFEYQVSDLEAVDLTAMRDDPLKFRARFMKADVPVTLSFVCFNVVGDQIRCATTYTALRPPPPPIIAVGGRLTLL